MTNQSYTKEHTFLVSRLTPYLKGTLAQWMRTLPLEFYLEIFKLHEWSFTVQRIDEKAGLLARWTQVYIFKRLQKEFLDELKKNPPESRQGTLIFNQVSAQLQLVMDRMQHAPDWNTFVRCFRNEFGEVPFYFSIDQLSETSKRQLEEAILRLSNAGKMKRVRIERINGLQ